MKVLQSDQLVNLGHDWGYYKQTMHFTLIICYCLVLCKRIIYLNIWVMLRKKIGKKLTHPHFQIENEDGMRFYIHNVCVTLTFFKPYMWNIIHHNIFTFKIRNINDNYLLYFNFFLNCYDIHLLLITLVDAFPWHLGFFHGCAIPKKPMDNVFCSFFSSSISSS